MQTTTTPSKKKKKNDISTHFVDRSDTIKNKCEGKPVVNHMHCMVGHRWNGKIYYNITDCIYVKIPNYILQKI